MVDTHNSESGISFTSVVGNRRTEPEREQVIDPRNWIDRMFLEFNETNCQTTGLEVVSHDCRDTVNLGKINYEADSITLLLDFGTGVGGSNHSLRGEDIVVLGGNRAGRAGQGRLWVPVSQFRQFLRNSNALLDYIETELPRLKAEAATARSSTKD